MEERLGKIRNTVYFADGHSELRETILLREHVLSLIVDEKPMFRISCTRNHLPELVTGKLFIEGLIHSRDELLCLEFSENEGIAKATLGQCRQEERTPQEKIKRPGPQASPPLRPEEIFQLSEIFRRDSELHSLTQGSHSCFLARNGELLFSCEDIGRHNAVDKAVGHALIKGIPLSSCMLYVSGRISVTMVEKVWAAGISVLASKAVPTLEAVELALRLGMTLICRAYPDSFEVYQPF